MESFFTPQFVTSVGLPGFICILTIFCVGKTNQELKTAIDALTQEIKASNKEQKDNLKNLEDEVKELKFKMNNWEARHNERH